MPPLFDIDLKSVSSEHYITEKAAINFPHSGCTTGGGHYMSYFGRVSGVAKVLLAGIHYPDTTVFFGEQGIINATDLFAKWGWMTEVQILFMADHYRAAADMVMKWALSESKHCNIELAEWFPSADEKQQLLDLLDTGKSKLQRIGKLEKVELWLSSQ